MQLESNVEIMRSLRKFYVTLKDNCDFELRHACLDDIDVFANEVDNLMNSFKLQINRAKALLKRINGRAELVKQHRLERLNQHMENEAIVVRIITIVTLLYLPATFVSVRNKIYSEKASVYSFFQTVFFQHGCGEISRTRT